VATAIKTQVDYLLFSIGKDDKDCQHHLDQIKQLVGQLMIEVDD
jgi:hypothetical protein